MPNNTRISLVTGAGGFVGGNLVRALVARGQTVHAIIRSEKANWRLADIADKITIHHVDLSDAVTVQKVIEQVQPDIVYHAATYGGYPAQNDIQTTIATNIIGSVNLMQACGQVKNLKRFINIGSSSEYGAKNEPMRESDILEPTTPYGVTKAAQTLFAQYFAEKKNVPLTTLRLLAVYGPYEELGRLMSDLMCALVRRVPLKLSSPANVRDFVFVGDVVNACIQAAEAKNVDGEIFNIGGGREYAIGDTVKLAMQVSGSKIPLEWGAYVNTRAFETQRWVADISKAERVLGWKPAHSFEDGLRETFSWYQSNIQLYGKDS